MNRKFTRGTGNCEFTDSFGRSCTGGTVCMQNWTVSAVLALITVMTFLVTVLPANAASQAPDSNGYEIPLGELQKAKKERPHKKESKERRKKKGGGAETKPAYGVVVAPEQGDKAATSTPVAAPQVKNINSDIVKPVPVAKASEVLTIQHDPYSYVITGKRTTIQAIISSTSNIQSVFCRFRSTDSGTSAQVPMVTTPGTFFTYTVTLPALAQGSKELRYSIVAVDASGNNVQSPEFIVAVKATSVLPGWQSEVAAEAIKIKLEQKDRPLEGFADPGISE